MFTRGSCAAALASATGALWLWAEFIDRRSSGRCLGAPSRTSTDRQPPASDAVVVLGYRNRGARANFVNRFRVRAGIRSLDPDAADSVLILCGGAVGSATPEARIMERYARDELGHDGRIALDTTSRSTWENIANAIQLIGDADTIKIVSNAPHAQMGREILWRQSPQLAARLVRGAEHRFGEAPLLTVLSALRAVQSRRSGAWSTAAGAHD